VSDQKNLMSDDHGSVIHYEAGQHVARITLNRPGKLNATFSLPCTAGQLPSARSSHFTRQNTSAS
jgi:1,4-dihydroxy-2-naphthoyl-CoA synthase